MVLIENVSKTFSGRSELRQICRRIGIEAAESIGATLPQMIIHFLVPEPLGSMMLALTTGTSGLLGAAALAGYVGGGRPRVCQRVVFRRALCINVKTIS